MITKKENIAPINQKLPYSVTKIVAYKKNVIAIAKQNVITITNQNVIAITNQNVTAIANQHVIARSVSDEAISIILKIYMKNCYEIASPLARNDRKTKLA